MIIRYGKFFSFLCALTRPIDGEPINSRWGEGGGAGEKKGVGAGRDRKLGRGGCLVTARNVYLPHHIDDVLVQRILSLLCNCVAKHMENVA